MVQYLVGIFCMYLCTFSTSSYHYTCPSSLAFCISQLKFCPCSRCFELNFHFLKLRQKQHILDMLIKNKELLTVIPLFSKFFPLGLCTYVQVQRLSDILNKDYSYESPKMEGSKMIIDFQMRYDLDIKVSKVVADTNKLLTQ